MNDEQAQRMIALLERIASAVEGRASPKPSQSSFGGDDDQCPEHGKSMRNNRGLFCPSKLPDGSWCDWSG